jgi:hypothetical protein
MVLGLVALGAFLLGAAVVRTLWPPSQTVVVYAPPVVEPKEAPAGCGAVLIVLFLGTVGLLLYFGVL